MVVSLEDSRRVNCRVLLVGLRTRSVVVCDGNKDRYWVHQRVREDNDGAWGSVLDVGFTILS